MRKIVAFQTVSSLMVVVTLALAQITALLLTLYPASTFLWYADREVFRFVGIANHDWMVEPAAICLSGVIAVLTAVAHRQQWHLLAGAISHICLLLAGQAVWGRFLAWIPYSGQSFLSGGATFVAQPNVAILVLSTSAAILSAAACHFVYVCTIAQSRPGAAPALQA